MSTNTGPLATASWLASRGLLPDEARWFVDITLPTDEATTQLQLEIYAQEWGIAFRHLGRASWIRVTDLPFVHGTDDYKLLTAIPALKNIGDLVRTLEARYAIQFERATPVIMTSIVGAEQDIRGWVATL